MSKAPKRGNRQGGLITRLANTNRFHIEIEMITQKRWIMFGISFLGLSYLNAMTFDLSPLSESSLIEVELKTNGNFAKHGIMGNFSNIGGQINSFHQTHI